MRAKLWIGATLMLAAGATGAVAAGPVQAGGGPGIGALDASLSPDPVAPGATVTVESVDPCPIPDDGPIIVPAVAAGGPIEGLTWFVSTPNPTSPADIVDDGSASLDGDRHWVVTFPAPAEEGDYAFYGFCPSLAVAAASETDEVGAAGVTNPYQYGPILFTVEAAGALDFTAALGKASGLPGDDIDLTGIRCAGDSGAAALLPVGAPPASPADVDEAVLQQYDVVDGQFGGVVPVPAGTAPGTYQVVVWCMEGADVLDTEVLAYTVLAAAAPVPAAPSFTG
jgi:hypothetical protein